MEKKAFLSKLESIEKKELTEEEFLRQSESNTIVAGLIDVLLGIAVYCNLLGLLKTILFGELFYTGPLTSRDYISETRGIKLISQEVLEKISFDVMVVPLGILIVGGAVVFYHSRLSKKLKFLTPGEIIVGGKFSDYKEKIWENPHLINRSGLYLICILSLLILNWSFEGALGSKNVYSIVDIGIKYLILLLSIFGLYALGKGKLIGGFLFIASYIIGYLQSSKLSSVILFDRGIGLSPEGNLSKIFLGMIFIAIVALMISFINKQKVNKRLKLQK